MKISEMRDMSVEDLQGKSISLSEELCKLKIQHGIRPLENTSTLNSMSKVIARIQTVITEKQQ